MVMTRWKFLDPSDSSTFTFVSNPNQMNSVFPQKAIESYGNSLETYVVSNVVDGFQQTLVREQLPSPVQFQFEGRIYEKVDHDSMLFWSQKQNRLHLTDHVGRTWVVQNVSFSITMGRNPRRPWRQTYVMKMLLFGAA